MLRDVYTWVSLKPTLLLFNVCFDQSDEETQAEMHFIYFFGDEILSEYRIDLYFEHGVPLLNIVS